MWLRRKDEQHGFAVDPLHVRALKLGELSGKRRQQTLHLVQFDGVLEVLAPETFASQRWTSLYSGRNVRDWQDQASHVFEGLLL